MPKFRFPLINLITGRRQQVVITTADRNQARLVMLQRLDDGEYPQHAPDFTRTITDFDPEGGDQK